MNLVLTACSENEFKELPHSRWIVMRNKEIKIGEKVVAIKLGKECSATICRTQREAWETFNTLVRGPTNF